MSRFKLLAAAAVLSLTLWAAWPMGVHAEEEQAATPANPEATQTGTDATTAEAPVAAVLLPALSVLNSEIQTENETPRACFAFSAPLATMPAAELSGYVSVAPEGDFAASITDGKLCLSGFAFGSTYTVTLKPGLKSEDGKTGGAGLSLKEASTQTVTFPDHESSLSFKSSGVVLPKLSGEGVPLRSINVQAITVQILRINDRNLVRTVAEGMTRRALDPYTIDRISQEDAERVYQGRMEIEAKRNEWTTTAIPVKDVLTQPKPGIYVVTAVPVKEDTSKSGSADEDEDYSSRWQDVATQWFVISDIGLSAFRAEDGLAVVARSLSATAPLARLELSLYARNNSLLGTVKTDRTGLARFAPGLLNGKDSNAPALLVANAPDNQDFAYLDLGNERAIDMTDRGDTGRATPGPLDAYVVTERGIYRPGETIHSTILLRDRSLAAPSISVPLTVTITRPDGAVAKTLSLSEDLAGGYSFDFPTAISTMSGNWQITVKADPAQPPIGLVSFMVDDFQPPRLEFDLKPLTAVIDADGNGKATIDARFLYGAPAANLTANSSARLRMAQAPFPDFKDYHFGLEEEELLPQSIALPGVVTDNTGHADLEVVLGQLPDTTHPLEANITADLFDVGGRPVSRNLVVPVRNLPLNLGVRLMGESVKSNTDAKFEVIVLDQSGARTARSKLTWTLYQEKYDFIWAILNGRWRFDSLVHAIKVQSDTVDVAADKPAEISVPVTEGYYRLEVRDEAQNLVASSVRFTAGWWSDPKTIDRPDVVAVTHDPEKPVSAGDKVTVHITAPYASAATIVAATHTVGTPLLTTLPAEGKDVTLDVPEGVTNGFYVLVSAVQKPAAGATATATGAPLRRAMGLVWVPVDPTPHQLKVSVDTPDLVRPNQVLEAKVHVEGAENGSAYVTLAAVDDGVLQLTNYQSPNPDKWFLGQTLLGVTPFDLYGDLIDASGALKGVLHEGGDGAEMSRQMKGAPEPTVKVVSLFSGIVKVENGIAAIPLDLPDFNGRLRLMAMAWSKTRFGEAEKQMTVRAPLVADLMLPRFLAPNDTASVVLSVDNRDAPAGSYHVELTSSGPVGVAPQSAQDVSLATGERKAIPLTLTAAGVGETKFDLSITGPENFSLTRSFNLSVRAGSAATTTRRITSVKPGETATLTADLAAMVPGTADVSLSFSPLPDIDVPFLLKDLMHYPYGCAEQTVSTAMPFLYMQQVASGLGIESSDSYRDRVNFAIAKLADIQRLDGGFGLWKRESDYELWLSAYIADFLTRAGEQHFTVPTTLRTSLLAKLASSVKGGTVDDRNVTGAAYAFYVLARNQSVAVDDLRYFADNSLSRLPTNMSRAMLAAALKLAGDNDRAKLAVDSLDQVGSVTNYYDYGSELRNNAATVTLLAENNLADTPRLLDMTTALKTPEWDRGWWHFYTTQEETWLLLAVHAMQERSNNQVHIRLGEDEYDQKSTVYRTLSTDDFGLALTNLGSADVYQTTTITGVPVTPEPAAANGFTLTRSFYLPNGKAADMTTIKQNDLIVVVLSGATNESYPQSVVIADMLPAGFEIENMRISGNNRMETMAWLGDDLSTPLSSELRSDRFVAAINLGSWWDERNFKVAYLMRAVTPGHFFQPAPYVEDMYRPAHFARGETGLITIAPAQ